MEIKKQNFGIPPTKEQLDKALQGLGLLKIRTQVLLEHGYKESSDTRYLESIKTHCAKDPLFKQKVAMLNQKQQQQILQIMMPP